MKTPTTIFKTDTTTDSKELWIWFEPSMEDSNNWMQAALRDGMTAREFARAVITRAAANPTSGEVKNDPLPKPCGDRFPFAVSSATWRAAQVKAGALGMTVNEWAHRIVRQATQPA